MQEERNFCNGHHTLPKKPLMLLNETDSYDCLHRYSRSNFFLTWLQVDLNGDGQLDKKELLKLVTMAFRTSTDPINQKLLKSFVEVVMQVGDTDNDGLISPEVRLELLSFL